MQRSSKAANLEVPVYDINQVEFIDNRNMAEAYQQSDIATSVARDTADQEMRPISGRTSPRRNQPNSKQKLPVSRPNNSLLESPSVNSAAPNIGEPSKTPQTAGVKHGSRAAGDDQPQLDQVNANPDYFGRHGANASHENPNPLHEQVEIVPSPTDSTSEPLHHHGGSSNQQPEYTSRIEGTDSSHGDADATDANAQQTRSPSYSPLIMEATHPFPLALAEKMPENGSYAAQSLHSENEVTSAEANGTNGQVGSSRQAELLRPQPLQSLNREKNKIVMSADQFEQNGNGNKNVHDNQQGLPYPTLFPQNPSGRGFLNGGSTQIDQQLPPWLSNTRNDLYRPVAPSGSSEFNPFKATGSSGAQSYNFMPPRASAPLRPTSLNNSLPPINQGSNMPTATGSVLRQHSVLPRSPILPMQPMPQYPYQPGAYNSQTLNTILPESSLPLTLRIPTLPPEYQLSPLGVSDLQFCSSVQPKATMPSSGRFIFQDSSDHHHQDPQLSLAAPTLRANQIGGQSSNSVLQGSSIYSGSHQFPAHQQARNQFSMNPTLPNSENPNYVLPENPILPRLQRVEQQATKPIPRYARSGNALTTMVFNSLLEAEKNGGSTTPYRIDPSTLSSQEQEEIQLGSSWRPRGHARSRFEVGESSSFKRFRRESNMVQPASITADQGINTSLSLQNNENTTTSEVTASADLHPRAIRNSLYDPIYEGLGLYIDPHLRLFARNH